MKTYYFKDNDGNDFSVQAENAKAATTQANTVAERNTGESGLFGLAFFKGCRDNDDGDIYLSGKSTKITYGRSDYDDYCPEDYQG